MRGGGCSVDTCTHAYNMHIILLLYIQISFTGKPPQQPYKDNDGIHNGEVQQMDNEDNPGQQAVDRQRVESNDL